MTSSTPGQKLSQVVEKAENLLILVLFVFGALLAFMLVRPKRRSSTRLNLRQSLSDGKFSGESDNVREVNVVFQFNGHDFDAYEVLGVPAGANLDLVAAAYENALASMDPESHELLEMAYKAIEQRRA